MYPRFHSSQAEGNDSQAGRQGCSASAAQGGTGSRQAEMFLECLSVGGQRAGAVQRAGKGSGAGNGVGRLVGNDRVQWLVERTGLAGSRSEAGRAGGGGRAGATAARKGDLFRGMRAQLPQPG